MVFKRLIFAEVFFSLAFIACTIIQTNETLPRSTPEAEGVSSEGILKFIEAAEKSNNELHSFMFLRHGKVIAEGWWSPYGPNLKHTMHSVSKSFTSTALGLAVNEKLISVDDKVISFFPKDLPDTISPNLSELRIKDLLCMAVGQEKNPRITDNSNWVKDFLAEPVVTKPGTKFLYSSLGTYMLSAIIQKKTGEKLIDYLTPRLFEPLGIEGMDWEESPQSINTGGWGLRIKTEDMAKFGQLYLQKGMWNGQQILPKQWVEEASTFKIQQGPNAYFRPIPKDSCDWQQGYCYQMWRCRYNAFRVDGLFGQFIVVMPDQDAVIILTSESFDMQDELDLVWEYLLPAINDNKMPADNSLAILKQKLSSLSLPICTDKTNTTAVTAISGKTYEFENNDQQIETISFNFKDDSCKLALKIDTSSYEMTFGLGAWQIDEINKSGPYLLSAKANIPDLTPIKAAGAYQWKDENILNLKLQYLESANHEDIICQFDQNKILIDLQNSRNKENKLTLRGTLKN